MARALPFDSRGKPVHSNDYPSHRSSNLWQPRANGRTLEVRWKSDSTERESYFYTLSEPIRRVPPEKPIKGKQWEYDALNSFTFENRPQDITRFLEPPRIGVTRFGPIAPVARIAELYAKRPREFANITNRKLDKPTPSKSIVTDGCFLDQPTLESMLHRLQTKQNIILQGPPGTGKTWLAKKIGLRPHRAQGRNQSPAHAVPPQPLLRGFRARLAAAGRWQALALVDGPFLQIVEEATNRRRQRLRDGHRRNQPRQSCLGFRRDAHAARGRQAPPL